MNKIENREGKPPDLLLTCRYDESEDVFVVLTKLGLERLRRYGLGSEKGY